MSAHYILNLVGSDARSRADAFLRAARWGIGADEPHGAALAAGDLVLLYLGAPERLLIGCAELASSADEAGVALTQLERWEPPVPMGLVLSQIDRSGGARADFDVGVVLISEREYETALAVAAGREAPSAPLRPENSRAADGG
jgi:hypothetical protein